MEDFNKPTKQAGSFSNSPRSSGVKLTSAEERLKKSLKSLSHASGGAGNINLQSSVSAGTKRSGKAASRKQVGGVVLDLETIKDANRQKLTDTRRSRNRAIIVILSILLAISLVYLAIVVVNYTNSKDEGNCKYYVTGTASDSCAWVIEGERQVQFDIGSGLAPDMIYWVNSQLEINTFDEVKVTVYFKPTMDGTEFLIGGLHEPHDNLLRVETADKQPTNKFVYQGSITEGGTITLFKGIDFTGAPGKINSNNIILEITVQVDYVNN